MQWLMTYYIWVLTVVAPGGLETQLGVHATPEACEAAREKYTQQQELGLRAGQEDLGLRAECRQRVRAQYQ
jgi:hypothetical protein